jgi:hypothetical protein
MIKNRIVKWGTAGVLALGTIPALALAKSHVSLPTSDITVTPTTAMEAPAAKTLSHVTRVKSAKVRKASTKTRTSKHHKGTASHHVKSSKAVSTHKKSASAKARVRAASNKAHKTSSSKVIRLD